MISVQPKMKVERWKKDGNGHTLLGRKRGLRMRAGSMPCNDGLRSLMSRLTCDVTGTNIDESPTSRSVGRVVVYCLVQVQFSAY